MVDYDDAEVLTDADEVVGRIIKQVGSKRSSDAHLYRLRDLLLQARDIIYSELESMEDDCND